MRKELSVHQFRRLLMVLVGAALCAGCRASEPEESPYRLTASVREVMEASVDPPARAIWASVSTTYTLAGTENKAPHTDEEWEAVEHSALDLAEAANLLLLPGRAPGAGDWLKHAHALVDAAVEARKATLARDPERVFEAGGTIYEVCSACHAEYYTTDRVSRRYDAARRYTSLASSGFPSGPGWFR